MKKSLLLLMAVPLIAGAFYLRSMASWRPKRIFASRDPISQLVFSRDGQTLLVLQHPYGFKSSSEAQGKRATLLDVRHEFVPLWRSPNYPSHNPGVTPQFLANDSQVLLGGNSLWRVDARSGKSLTNYKGPWDGAMSPDGKFQAISFAPGKGRVGIISTSQPFQQGRLPVSLKILGRVNQTAQQFAFSPDGKTFVVGVGDQQGTHLDFYDTTSWKRTRTWSDRNFKSGPNDLPVYLSLKWSQSGKMLFSSWQKPSSNATGSSVWRVSDGQKSMDSHSPTPSAEELPAEIDDEGRTLVVSFYTIKRTEIYNGSFETIFSLPKGSTNTAAISPDGSYLVVGTSSGEVFRQRLK